MKWQDLDAEQRYEMIEMVRSGRTTVAKLSATLEVTRATLYNAIQAVEEAAKAALEPGKPGRKPKPEPEVRASELLADKARLEKELALWQTKYEVASTLLNFERMLDRGEELPGEKKRRKRGPVLASAAPGRSGPGGSGAGLETTSNGGRAADHDAGPGGVDGPEEGGGGAP